MKSLFIRLSIIKLILFALILISFSSCVTYERGRGEGCLGTKIIGAGSNGKGIRGR